MARNSHQEPGNWRPPLRATIDRPRFQHLEKYVALPVERRDA